MDVPMDSVDADRVDDTVGAKHRENLGFCADKPNPDPCRRQELVDLQQLRRALGVDEVDPFEVEHDRP